MYMSPCTIFMKLKPSSYTPNSYSCTTCSIKVPPLVRPTPHREISNAMYVTEGFNCDVIVQ